MKRSEWGIWGMVLNNSSEKNKINVSDLCMELSGEYITLKCSGRSIQVKREEFDLSYPGLKPIADFFNVEVKDLWKAIRSIFIEPKSSERFEELKEIINDRTIPITDRLMMLREYTNILTEVLKGKLLDCEGVRNRIRNVKPEELEIVLFDKVKVEEIATCIIDILRELNLKFVKFPNDILFVYDGWHMINYDVISVDVEALFNLNRSALSKVLKNELKKYAETIDPEIVNPRNKLLFNNGVLDLNTLIFTPLNDRIRLYFTFKLPYNVNISLLSRMKEMTLEDWKMMIPNFLQLLRRVFPDEQNFNKALEMLGSILIPSVIRKIFIVYGPPGVGKSTLTTILLRVLGPVASTLSLNDLTESKYNYQLYGKLVNITSEGSRQITVDGIARLNRYTGELYLTFEEKFKPRFQGRNMTKIIMLLNEFPTLKKFDDALIDRLYLIETTDQPIELEKPLDQVISEIEDEAEGIIHFLLWCMTRIYVNGYLQFKHEQTIEDKRELLIEMLNPINDWIEECCEQRGREERKKLYASYIAWARENGKQLLTKQQFYSLMREKYLEKRIDGIDYFEGIKLKNEVEKRIDLDEILKVKNQ